jgi:hypothetical protein
MLARTDHAVKGIECPTGFFCRGRIALQEQLVAARTGNDTQLALDMREIFVKLAVKRVRVFVVVKGQDDLGHIGCALSALQLFNGAQTSFPSGQWPSLSLQLRTGQTVPAHTGDSHIYSLTDFRDSFIKNYGLQPRASTHHLAGVFAGLFNENIHVCADF